MNGTTYKPPTEYSATRTLLRFFSKSPDSNSVTKDEIFASWERDKPEYAKKNEGWLSNKLVGIYSYNLAKPVYSYHPYRKLERLELTIKGKRALGRVDVPGVAEESTNQPVPYRVATTGLTVDDILMAVPKINERLTTHRLRVVLEDKEVPAE